MVKMSQLDDELKNKERALATLQASVHSKEEDYESTATQMRYDVEHYKGLYEDLKKSTKSVQRYQLLTQQPEQVLDGGGQDA